MRINKEKLEDFCAALLQGMGIPEGNARYISEMAVLTEAMGISTHGLVVINFLSSQIPSAFTPDTEPEIVKEKGGTVLIDAKSGFSQDRRGNSYRC